ncbi:hypothetical protein FA13DRAFT_757346 [Coprinellus micaceus]|uniref:F-box domain-containing protein n=1 Tax=Coprinellus micaceus TaxID=71717 RepID=A0A4Y7T3L7_COPMI|nr:hypothetical protein FA13DRAFT_757346 [Coprinellus micaceus]
MPLSSFSLRSLRSCSRKRQRGELTLRFPFPKFPIPRDGAKTAATTLPYEILQVIFSMAMEASSSDIDLAEKAFLRANILAFSQVCGQWRYAAQGYSVLWVHAIDFQRYPPEGIAHYLRLSRPRPIDVGHRSAPLRISGNQGRITLNNLKMDAHRVRQWNIRLASDFQYMNLQFLFGLPNDTASYPVHALRQTGIANIPYYRWKSLVSSLERLSLCDTNLVLIPSMELSNLTELSIASIHHRSIKYRIMEMVALLRKVPRLQFLRLENAIGLGPGDNPIAANQPIPPVNLPDLRLISLLETGWETAYLLLLLVPILQKPDHCGVDMFLPSFSDLEYVRTPVNEIIRALLLVQQGIRESWLPQIATTPRVELAFKSRWYRGCEFTMGTVPDPEATLDWNGNSGSLGVKRYLDSYFDPPSLGPFEVLHRPLNVSLYNPNAVVNKVTYISNSGGENLTYPCFSCVLYFVGPK